MSIEETILKRGVAEIIKESSLEKKLKGGKKLRIKWGVDPTAPDLHLGHVVVINKLKQFQEAGHTVIFLIGDYTSLIGDPSGRSKTRPMLKEAEIKKFAKTYLDQIGKTMDAKKIEIRRNSEWFKKMKFNDVIKLCAQFSLSRVIERDDFEKRIKKGLDVRYHEGIYPIMQGYDSVILKADVEIGGTDQNFNLLAGRVLQRRHNQKPQDVLMMPILPGIDGQKKMSKSQGNYVGVDESPDEQFGKIMSIPDKLIVPYFEMVAPVEDFEVEEAKKELELGENPKEVKERLATIIVKHFHDQATAEKARERFHLIFASKEIPDDIPEVKIKEKKCEDLPGLLVELKLASSKNEAKRLVLGGAVKVDKAKIEDPNAPLCIHDGMVIQVGKRKFIRLKTK